MTVLTDDRRKGIAAVVAIVVGTTVLKRSRLARLGAVVVAGAAGYHRLARKEPVWHDVEAPR
jgi:hypothetical protein